jgi:hypothetical protein
MWVVSLRSRCFTHGERAPGCKMSVHSKIRSSLHTNELEVLNGHIKLGHIAVGILGKNLVLLYFFWHYPELLWGPPSLLPNGYQGLFPWGVKRPGREADHLPPSSAEVKEWVELYLNSYNTSSWRGALLKAQGQLRTLNIYFNIILPSTTRSRKWSLTMSCCYQCWVYTSCLPSVVLHRFNPPPRLIEPNTGTRIHKRILLNAEIETSRRLILQSRRRDPIYTYWKKKLNSFLTLNEIRLLWMQVAFNINRLFCHGLSVVVFCIVRKLNKNRI